MSVQAHSITVSTLEFQTLQRLCLFKPTLSLLVPSNSKLYNAYVSPTSLVCTGAILSVFVTEYYKVTQTLRNALASHSYRVYRNQ